jgi:CBS domain-containing protein
MSGLAISVLIVAVSALFVIAVVTLFALGLADAVQGWRKRQTPLNKVFKEARKTHSVAPDTLVSECVRLMTSAKVGSVVVLDGQKVVGIFTERDALNKVLAGGLDPAHTKVSEVMTRDPFCVPATMTVDNALKVISERRFRHLPITQGGRFVTVVSSGDLTHWLIESQRGVSPGTTDLVANA